ncbi:ATP-binding protein [Luteococcus sp. OSA5]|uniref:sensor histidine kinase n=1 Tax=Luteococcus sp. OSA5 TaxID=3401630 RepID=UPI003B435BF9
MPHTRSASVQDGLRVLGTASLALTLPLETIPFVLIIGHQAPATAPGLFMVLSSQLLALVFLLARRPVRGVEWLLFALLFGGILQVLRQGAESDAVSLLLPGYWLFPIIVVSMRSRARRTHVGITLGTGLVMMALQDRLVEEPSWLHLADLLWITQPVTEVLLFGTALISISLARDEAVRAREQADAQLREEMAQRQAGREAARLLHDHVLHALLSISRTGQAIQTREALDECRAATVALSAPRTASGLIRVEELLRDDPLLERCGARLSGQTRPVPIAVASCVADAAREALRNVARHAAGARCQVTVSTQKEILHVQIDDDGPGFDQLRRPVDRLGVGGSILQRMDEVGGAARISSRLGRGTRVHLQWPRLEPEADQGWQLAPRRLVRRGLSRTAWPGLVTATVMTLLMSSRTTRPSLAMTVSLMVLAIGFWAAITLDRRELSTREQALVVLSALVGWVVNLALVRQSPTLDYALWMGWGSSSMVHLVVLSIPLRRAAVLTGAWMVVCVAGLLSYPDPLMTLWSHTFLLITGAGHVAITVLVLAVAQRTAAHEAEAARLASVSRAATARLRHMAHLEEHWSATVVDEALPLIRGVADGLVDPLRPEAREQARCLESRLRDETLLGAQRRELAGPIGKLRSQGWAPVLSLGTSSSRRNLSALARLLELLGPPSDTGQVLTLSQRPKGAQAVVLSPQPDQLERWRRQLSGADEALEEDPDFARLTVAC